MNLASHPVNQRLSQLNGAEARTKMTIDFYNRTGKRWRAPTVTALTRPQMLGVDHRIDGVFTGGNAGIEARHCQSVRHKQRKMQATMRSSTVRGHTPKRLQGSKVVVGLEQLH